MSKFKYKNKNIYYKEIGEGSPILFLHGNTASSNMFLNIIDKYKGYKIILFDFLGNGRSDRIEEFPSDLWYEQARSVIAFLEEKSYGKINIIGTSGGALTAINIALERKDLVNKIIADSFEGEVSNESFWKNIKTNREKSKEDKFAVMFYKMMHGEDFIQVIDNDTKAIYNHGKNIKRFFHKSIYDLKVPTLFTGSKEDEFTKIINENFYEDMFSQYTNKINNSKMYIFNNGSHPSIISNEDKFAKIAKEFFNN